MKRHLSAPKAASGRAGWAWALLGFLAGVGVSVAYHAPARWLTGLVSPDSPVQLVEPAGRIWSGSARIALTAGPGSRDRALLPDRIEWSVGATTSTLIVHVRARCCMSQTGQIRLSIKDWRPELSLADLQSIWPADVLAGLGTPLNTLKPAGNIHLSTQGLHWGWSEGRAQWRGLARLDIQNLSTPLSPLKPIGRYQVDLSGGARPSISLKTSGGALLLQGRGHWLEGRLHFTGEASTSPELEPVLNTVLNIIGQREGRRSILSLGRGFAP